MPILQWSCPSHCPIHPSQAGIRSGSSYKINKLNFKFAGNMPLEYTTDLPLSDRKVKCQDNTGPQNFQLGKALFLACKWSRDADNEFSTSLTFGVFPGNLYWGFSNSVVAHGYCYANKFMIRHYTIQSWSTRRANIMVQSSCFYTHQFNAPEK